MSQKTKDEIMAESTPTRQADVLIDVIMRGSRRRFSIFLESLKKSNQHEVLKTITGPQTHEGAVEKIEPRLLATVMRHEDTLISNIRFEGSFIQQLYSCGVVTETKMHDLKAIPNRLKRAEALLSYFKRGAGNAKLESFAEILGKTGQGHLQNLILHEDVSDVLSDEHKRAIQTQLAENVDIALQTGLIYKLQKLEATGVVTACQRDEIQQEKTERGRAELLLDIIQCRPASALHNLPLSIEGGKFIIKEGDLIKTYQHKLKDFMKTEPLKSNRKLQSEFGLEVGTAVFFISLLIVPRNVMGHRVKDERQFFEQRHDTYIEVPDLFDKNTRAKLPRRVLVLGAAGSGKTTLVQHSCEEWAAGNLWPNFHYVFLLTCRRLNHTVSQNTKISMCDLLLEHGPQLDKHEKQNVKRELLANQEHTLVIIDGIDELAKWDDFMAEDLRQIQDMEEPAVIMEIFHSILGGNLMNKTKFIVTSRPIDRIDANQFERGVKIFGFGKDAIKKCILALSSGDKEKCKGILEYLDLRPQLKMFCTLPLGCIMTGKVVFDELSDTSESKDPHETINCATLLIIRVIFVLMQKRNTQTTSRDRLDLIRQGRNTLVKIMQLAAFGILDKSPQIIFDTKALRDHGIGTYDLRYGLLDIESDQRDFSNLPQNATCSFIHLSIQEFFAALHIAVTWKKKDINMITSREASDQFSMVLLYLSGLLGNPLGRTLIQAIDDSVKSQKLSKQLTKLFDKLVVQYEGRLHFLPTFTRKGKEGTKLGRLQLIRCVAEGNNKDLVQKIDRLVLKTGTLDLTDMPGGIHPEHIPAISFYLQSTQAIKSLMLERHYCVYLMRMITTENQARLVPLLDGCVLEGPPAQEGEPSCTLNLSGEKLTEEDVRGVAQYIVYSTAIRELRLEKMYCVNVMPTITPENQARLVHLLDGCVLEGRPGGGEEPSGMLNLTGEKLTEEDVRGVSQYIVHSTTICDLRLEQMYCINMMRMITQENQARLVPLLDGCVLEGPPAQEGEPSCILNLSGEKLTEEDVGGVAQYLIHSTAIRELRLEKMYCVNLMRIITGENQARLVPLLDGACLVSEHLDLRGIKMSEDDVTGLIAYVMSTKSLQTIDTYAAVQLMRGMTPEHHDRLVTLLETTVLPSGCLDLDDIHLKEEEVSALVTYALDSPSLRTVAKYTAVQLMRGMTPDNHDRLVTLLDTAVLTSGCLDLDVIHLKEDEIPALVTYTLDTRSLRSVEKYTAVQLMRGITPENQARLVPLVDTAVLTSGCLDLDAIPLTEVEISALVSYTLETQSVQKVEKYTAVRLMRGITTDNRVRIMALLDMFVLEGQTDGDTVGRILNLSTVEMSEADLQGVLQYIIQSPTKLELRLKKMYCVNLMRKITPENQARLVPLLDGACIVSGHLYLQDIELSKDDISGLIEYVLTTTSIQTIEPDIAIQLMRGITLDNRTGLIPLLDKYVLEGRTDGDTMSSILNLTRIDQAGLVPLLDKRRTLSLTRIEMPEADLHGVLQYINQSSAVFELSFMWNMISDSGAAALASLLKTNKRLHTLDLANNIIYDSGATALAWALERNTTLGSLNLSNNNISDSGAAALASALYLNTTLTDLNLANNMIQDSGATALASALERNTTLSELDLKDNMILDSGATALASALERNTTLRELILSQNSISGRGAAFLATALKSNTKLEKLYLNNNTISDSGAAALASALARNTTLTELNLNNNMISDSGAAALGSALERNTTLSELNLWENKLSDGKKKELEQQLEDRVWL